MLPIRPNLQNQILEDSLDLLADTNSDNDRARRIVFNELLEVGRDPRARLEAQMFDRESIDLRYTESQDRWRQAFLALWIEKAMRKGTANFGDDWPGVVRPSGHAPV